MVIPGFAAWTSGLGLTGVATGDFDSYVDALEYVLGTDLATWPLVYTVGADTATSTAGVTIVENGSAADAVTVTIPMGSDTRRFARVKVTVTP